MLNVNGYIFSQQQKLQSGKTINGANISASGDNQGYGDYIQGTSATQDNLFTRTVTYEG